MAWENGYDIPGSAGGGNPLGIISRPGPTASDVLSAAGAGASITEASPGVNPTASGVTGSGGFESLAKTPAPGSKYPALGFDPAPGDLAEVARLVSTLSDASNKLGHAQDIVDKMKADKDSWQGEAAEAFHEKLSENLPKYLQEGHQSLSKAAATLRDWHTRLDGYQAKARICEADAQSARSSFGNAWTDAVSTAADSKSSLALQGKHFDSDAELQQADAEIKSAISAVEDATRRAGSAFTSLQQIISEAKSLADEHSDEASTVAKSLRAEAKDYAPHKPGLWSKISGWLKDHSADILSAAAALCGLIAFFCPIFAIPAVLLSAGAFTGHLRKDLHEDGAFSKPSTWITLAGDALGAFPGLGMVAKGASLARGTAEIGELASNAGKAETLWRGAQEVGKTAGGENAVGETLQRVVNKVHTGDWNQVSDASELTAKRFQLGLNFTSASLATEGLVPRVGDNDSFSAANDSYGVTTGVPSSIDSFNMIRGLLRHS